MARAKIADFFKTEFQNAIDQPEITQYMGVGGSRLFDVTFRVSDVAQQFVIGLNHVIAPAIAATSDERNIKKQGFETKRQVYEEIGKTITVSNLAKICRHRFSLIKKGTGGQGSFFILRVNSIKPWKSFTKKGLSPKGVYVLGRTQGGLGMTLRFARKGTGSSHIGATDKALQETIAEVRNAIYHDWLTKYAAKAAGELKYEDASTSYKAGGPTTKQSGYTEPDRRFGVNKPITRQRKEIITGHTEMGHQPGSEIGSQALNWLAQVRPDVKWNFTISVHDILEQIEAQTGIEIKRSSKKYKVAGYSWDYHIKTAVEYNERGTSPGDISSINDKTAKAINRVILKSPRLWKLFFMRGSHRPVDQVLDDVILDVTKDMRLAANRPRTKSGAYDMRFKLNRGLKNLKNFKPESDNISVKKPKKLKEKISRGTIVTRGKRKRVTTDKETGQGKEASTSQAADLARLKKEMNRNLSSEVRRNMGKPALSYRTGVFANSVQILNLMEARNTIIANYTYLLRPYQTFENTGRYRWPMSYNPKTLIAKSIRNLAQGRIEQKLTVRRV